MTQNEAVAIDTGRRVDIKTTSRRPKERRERKAPPARPEPEIIVMKAPVAQPVTAVPLVRPEAVEWDDTGDFGAMLDAAAPVKKLDVQVGSRVRAKVIYLSKDTAFFALGQKHEASMSMAELLGEDGQPTVKVGDVLDLYVVAIDESIQLSKKVSRFGVDSSMLEEAKTNRMPVEGKITAANAGGVEVLIAGARAFCPVGQLDLHFVENPGAMIGQTHLFVITQISNGGRNIVVSRRALLERERAEKSKERLSTLNVGDRVNGTVSRMMDFGAFVELGGIEGLIPVSEFGDRVKVGDHVTVDVTRIEPDPKRQGQMRIGLSLKSAMPDPFAEYSQYLIAGTSLEGKVARLESFGAFVELFPGLDGLIHISELSEQRVRHPSEVLKIGDPVTVRILEVDFDRRRISLSLRENVQRGSALSQGPSAQRGDKVEGVVERIERYGIFVKLANGQSALLPASESGQPRGADLSKAFPIGEMVPLMVIDVDERGRLRVSKVAREKSEDQELVRQFSSSQTPGKLGTFADLFDKLR